VRHTWTTVVLSIAAATLFVGGAIMADGLTLTQSEVMSQTPLVAGASGYGDVPSMLGGGSDLSPADFGICSVAYEVVTLSLGWWECQAYLIGINQVVSGTAPDMAANILISLENYLNATASQAANFNATSQELTSYYADRAEALVPEYLNHTWNTTTADEILAASGLPLTVIGMESVTAFNEWQVWNATLTAFQSGFGKTGLYCSGCGGIGASNLLDTEYSPGDQQYGRAEGIFYEGNQGSSSFSVSPPFELWPSVSGPGGTPETYYMSLAYGGTIASVDYYNSSLYHTYPYSNWSVTDLRTGHTYTIPHVGYQAWYSENNMTNPSNGAVPIISKTDDISPFDLLRVTCTSGCQWVYAPLMTIGAFNYENITTSPATQSGVYGMSQVLSGTPLIAVNSHADFGTSHFNLSFILPTVYYNSSDQPYGISPLGVCAAVNSPTISGAGACTTQMVSSLGNATQISGGAGQAVGGELSLIAQAKTYQHLVNNTQTMAHAYYDVLRVLTNDSQVAIPADCAIPTPSSAFPAATNPANYQLSLANIEAVYLGYLTSIARFYNQSNINGLYFCEDPYLALNFGGTTPWNVTLNITASIYLGTPGGPVYPNGTADPTAKLSTPSTWPIRSVSPTLLYPFEYQTDVPTGQVYPVPYNDPIAALFINWSGNTEYGQMHNFTPNWGFPTYSRLEGYGNLVQVSGSLSSQTSGGNNSTGDAIYIPTGGCVLAGNPVDPCDVSVLYFDNFTYGIVHALIFPSCQQVGDCPGGGGGGGGGLSGTNDCGFGVLNQFYDSWAGYIGSAIASGFGHLAGAVAGIPIIGGGLAYIIKGIGCILAWIIVLVIFIVFIYVVAKVAVAVYRGVRGVEQRHRENVS